MIDSDYRHIYEMIAPLVITDFFWFMERNSFAVVEICLNPDDKEKIASLRMFPRDGSRIKWIIERYLEWGKKR